MMVRFIYSGFHTYLALTSIRFFITLPAGLRKKNVRNTEYYLIDSTAVWIQNNVELCVLVLKIVPSFRVINVFCSCNSDFCATQKWTLVPSLTFRWKLIGSNTEGRSRDWRGKKSHILYVQIGLKTLQTHTAVLQRFWLIRLLFWLKLADLLNAANYVRWPKN